MAFVCGQLLRASLSSSLSAEPAKLDSGLVFWLGGMGSHICFGFVKLFMDLTKRDTDCPNYRSRRVVRTLLSPGASCHVHSPLPSQDNGLTGWHKVLT